MRSANYREDYVESTAYQDEQSESLDTPGGGDILV